METKVTNRDKVLLIVLAIIIVIFGAVMIPQYGIKDLIIKMKDTRAQITEQTKANDEKLADLTKAGVPAAFAENSGQAKKMLKNRILEEKYAALKKGQTSLTAKAYEVADKWLVPVKYVHYDAGNTSDVLYATVAITNNEEGYTEGEIEVDEEIHAVQAYHCTFSCAAADNAGYDLELNNLAEEDAKAPLCLLISTYNVLAERGSISVEGWTFDGGAISMDLTLYMPVDSHVDEYLIGECHVCGKPYYISDYEARLKDLPEGETEVTCDNADCGNGEPAVLTGEAIH